VIENFKLGTLARWGLTPEWFEAEAPRVIACSITGFGSRGPKAKLPGYDFLAQAESGLMSITGPVDGEPTKFGVSIVDFCTGQFATSAILAALNARHRTGRGQMIEANLYCTGLTMLINVASSHLMSRKPARRFGNGHPNAVPYREFACREGEIVLPIGNDAQFARLCECVGHVEWAKDPRFARMSSRVENRETVDAMLMEGFKAKPADAWIEILQAAGIPCSKINSVAEALTDPHTLANDMVVDIDHPSAGDVRLIGIPYRLSDTPVGIDRPPPVLGADTEEVLRELVGLGSEAVAELRCDGVV
jgi:glutaryl-CoA transferase